MWIIDLMLKVCPMMTEDEAKAAIAAGRVSWCGMRVTDTTWHPYPRVGDTLQIGDQQFTLQAQWQKA